MFFLKFKNPKVLLTFLLTFGLAMGPPLPGMSQNKTIEKLNTHFYPVSEEDSASFSYFKMTSLTKDSVKLERIFDRKNRLIRVIKTALNPVADFKEKTTDTYDPQGNILSHRIANLANGKFIETFFFDQKQVGQVLFEGNKTYHVIRNGEEKPSLKNSNDFEPRFTEPLETWNLYLINHLSIDQKKVKESNQNVIVGILVDEIGMVKKVEWANPRGAEPYLAEKAIAAVKGWSRNFLPALDSFGNPTEKWLYVPITYKKH